MQETLHALWQHRRRRLRSIESYEVLAGGRRSGLAAAVAGLADEALVALGERRQLGHGVYKAGELVFTTDEPVGPALFRALYRAVQEAR